MQNIGYKWSSVVSIWKTRWTNWLEWTEVRWSSWGKFSGFRRIIATSFGCLERSKSNNIEWLRVNNVSFSSLVPFAAVLQALITAWYLQTFIKHIFLFPFTHTHTQINGSNLYIFIWFALHNVLETHVCTYLCVLCISLLMDVLVYNL